MTIRICAASTLPVMAMALGCTQPLPLSEDQVLSVGSQTPAGEQVSLFAVTAESCWSDRNSLMSAEAMYYAMHDTYTTDPDDLYELMGWVPKCPLSELEYILESPDPESTCTVICPSIPCHGQTSSEQPWQWPHGYPSLRACRSQMVSLASAESMFYGVNNRYGTLDELIQFYGAPLLCLCPGCGYEYGLELPSSDEYVLSCPVPWSPTHGSVVTGISSWAD